MAMIANQFTCEVNKDKQQQTLKSRASFGQRKEREKTMNLPLKEKPNLL